MGLFKCLLNCIFFNFSEAWPCFYFIFSDLFFYIVFLFLFAICFFILFFIFLFLFELCFICFDRFLGSGFGLFWWRGMKHGQYQEGFHIQLCSEKLKLPILQYWGAYELEQIYMLIQIHIYNIHGYIFC